MAQQFNSNPFLPDTKVMVFSSGSEADDWLRNNCDKCLKGKPGEETCEIIKAHIRCTVNECYGYMPLIMAWRVGADYNPLYQQASLCATCRERVTGDEPF